MNLPSTVEIVFDSAGSEPAPTRPLLPFRVSPDGLESADSVEIEIKNDPSGEWFSLGVITPGATQTFDVGMNAFAVRAAAVYGETRVAGPELTIQA